MRIEKANALATPRLGRCDGRELKYGGKCAQTYNHSAAGNDCGVGEESGGEGFDGKDRAARIAGHDYERCGP